MTDEFDFSKAKRGVINPKKGNKYVDEIMNYVGLELPYEVKQAIQQQLRKAQLDVLKELKKEWINESIARKGEIMTDGDIFRLFVEPKINQLEQTNDDQS